MTTPKEREALLMLDPTANPVRIAALPDSIGVAQDRRLLARIAREIAAYGGKVNRATR